jgi:hypothetical protein
METRHMTVIRIPYVKEYVDKAGTVRRYFRKRGCKAVALPGVPGSLEFMEAYQSAVGTPLQRPARQGPAPLRLLSSITCAGLRSLTSSRRLRHPTG